MMRTAKNTDEYLSSLPAAQRDALESVRAIIKTVVPDLEERMSSGAPFFWYAGRRAFGLGAAQHHLSFYIMHGDVLAAHRKELAAYDSSRTVIRFTPDAPLPAALITKLVRARIAELSRSR